MDKCLYISKSALKDNVKFYLKQTKKDFIAVIKNNAYGHGVKEIISILEQEKILMYAVSNLKEAIEARYYTQKDILIMDKIFEYQNLDDKMIVTIISKKHLKQLIDLDKEIRVHLKINIGMKRKGIAIDEFEECIELIKNSKLKLEGIYTHYSSYKLKPVKKEYSLFKSIVDKLDNKNIVIHASSSVSSLVLEENITNAVRIGVGMYGLKKLTNKMENLKIVSELKCESINSYMIKNMDTFSYHNRYIGKKGYVIMVNVGYGDGLFYKNRIKGYVENTYIKEIGRRNMDNMYFYSKDYIMDKSEIELFGKNNKIDDFSLKYKIPVCQILASLNNNISKIIID